MAAPPGFLYIIEYNGQMSGLIQAPQCPRLLTQSRIDFTGGGSIQSVPFTGSLIEVSADAICSVLVGGPNPVATTNDSRFKDGVFKYFTVQPGDRLAVIANV